MVVLRQFYLFASRKGDRQSSVSQKGGLAIAYRHYLVSYMFSSLQLAKLQVKLIQLQLSLQSI